MRSLHLAEKPAYRTAPAKSHLQQVRAFGKSKLTKTSFSGKSEKLYELSGDLGQCPADFGARSTCGSFSNQLRLHDSMVGVHRQRGHNADGRARKEDV